MLGRSDTEPVRGDIVGRFARVGCVGALASICVPYVRRHGRSRLRDTYKESNAVPEAALSREGRERIKR